jgi:DNA (cytosine-5)-methyltransferase 1
MPQTLTVGSLFSGIPTGGLDLGLERAGMRVLWQCECDPFARRVLAKHWPGLEIYPDVTTLRGADVPRPDLLAGGFPCVDISRAGNRSERTGLAGRQSGLWFEFLRLIREIGPRYVLLENVPDLLYRGLGRILRDLAGSGFDAEWSLLRACAVGSPQARERLFVFAYPRGERVEGFVPQAIRRVPAFSWREGLRIASDLRKRSDVYAPFLCRADDGLPCWMDRLRTLGNGVVPQYAEYLGRMILDFDAGSKEEAAA